MENDKFLIQDIKINETHASFPFFTVHKNKSIQGESSTYPTDMRKLPQAAFWGEIFLQK